MKITLTDKDINFLKIIKIAMANAKFQETESSAMDSFVFAKLWLAGFLEKLEKNKQGFKPIGEPTDIEPPKKKKKTAKAKKKGKRK